MARKQETVSLTLDEGTCEVTLTAMDGNTGALLGVRLVQVFGPGITAVVAAMESNDMGEITKAASALVEKLTPEEFTKIKNQLFSGGQVNLNGEFHDLDAKFIGDAFSGNLGGLFRLVFAALKLNFSNFFEGLGIKKDTTAKLMAKMNKAAQAVQK